MAEICAADLQFEQGDIHRKSELLNSIFDSLHQLDCVVEILVAVEVQCGLADFGKLGIGDRLQRILTHLQRENQRLLSDAYAMQYFRQQMQNHLGQEVTPTEAWEQILSHLSTSPVYLSSEAKFEAIAQNQKSAALAREP